MARQARRRGLPAADANRETIAAVSGYTDQRDAIDLGRVALRGTGRDGDLVLARQVRVLAVAIKERRRLGDHAGCVEQFRAIHSGDRASGDIAHHVAASVHRGQAGALQEVVDLGKAVEPDIVELDILARGQFALAARVPLGDLTDRAQPLALRMPLGIFTRIMKPPILGLSW